MTLKRLVIPVFIFIFIIALVIGGFAWVMRTESGLNFAVRTLGRMANLPFAVYFDGARGNITEGFSLLNVAVMSGDAAQEIIRAKNVSVRLAFSSIELMEISLEQIEIDGADTTMNGLLTIINYFSSSSTSDQFVNLRAKSSTLRKIPALSDVSLSEFSLTKEGAVVLSGGIGGVAFRGSGNIPRTINMSIGGGSAKVDADFGKIPTVSAKFHAVGIDELLKILNISLPVEGKLSGAATAKFPAEGIYISGDIRAENTRATGVPLGSFSSPFEFKSDTLSFPKINATMRGMENLKGRAEINTKSGSGEFDASGEKLSLASLQSTYKLNFPVDGENGSFRAKVSFSPDGINGAISAKLPLVKIEKQSVENLALGIDFKNKDIKAEFKAQVFGAPVNGGGTINNNNIDMKANFENLNISHLSVLFPDIKKLSPKGIISAEIICKGNLKSPSFSGSAKSSKLTLNGMEFQKTDFSILEDGNFKIASGGKNSLNIAGKVDWEQEIFSAKGSAGNLVFPQVGGQVAANFELAGGFYNPSGSFKLTGENNTIYGFPIPKSSADVKIKNDTLSFEIEADGNGWKAKGDGRASAGGKLDAVFGIENIELRPLLARYGLDFGVGGKFTGDVRVKGTQDAPDVKISAKYPLTFRGLLLDKISLSIAPNGENFNISAEANIAGGVELKISGTDTKLASSPISIADIVKVSNPKLTSQVGGNFVIKFESKPKPVVILEADEISLFGFRITDLRIPVEFSKDNITFTVDRGSVGGTKMRGKGSVEGNKWKANLLMENLYLEPLTNHILAPRSGKLTGNGELHFIFGGDLSLSSMFGAGYFSASDGELSGLDGLKDIGGKIEFAKATGRFIYDGKDIRMTQGSFINSKPNDVHYRYVRFYGPLGIYGKGMSLRCTARVDIRAFNMLMGALDGLINFATGDNLLKSPIRLVTENILGIRVRAFSDITFGINGGWGDPIVSDIRLQKQVQRTTAIEWGKPREEAHAPRDFDITFEIPVGPGGSSESTEDAIMRGVFDSLFNKFVPKF